MAFDTLFLKNLIFTLTFPGPVLFLFPHLILHRRDQSGITPFSPLGILSGIIWLVSLLVLLSCIWQFGAEGKGTPAPIDPPNRMVVRRMYRYTRNPMYTAVLVALLAEAMFFQSAELVLYASLMFILFSLFVILYEEPTLRRRFGALYDDYCTSVPRWGIIHLPYNASGREPKEG